MFEDMFLLSFVIMGIIWSWREREGFKMFEVWFKFCILVCFVGYLFFVI